MRTAACELRLPDQSRFYDNVRDNAPFAQRVVTKDSRIGQEMIICGAGPSLAMLRDAWPDVDEIWACNSALPTLWDWGLRPTHGVTIDQNAAMLADAEFGRGLAVGYYVASSVHPDLVALLRRHKRRLTFFHSFLGIPDPEGWDAKAKGRTYEMDLYTRLYRTSIVVGAGLNTVPRAICLAVAMGFDRIGVYGADCACAETTERMPARDDTPGYAAWLAKLTMYADGRSVAAHGNCTMAEAEIDGRLWHTRPDMVISAQHLLRLEREYADKVTIYGETLTAALRDKDQAFLDQLPQLSEPGMITNFGRPQEQAA